MSWATCLPKVWSCSHGMASLTVSVSHDFGSCCTHEQRTLCRRKYHYLPQEIWGTILSCCSSMASIWSGNSGVNSPTPKTSACLQGYVPKNFLESWLCSHMWWSQQKLAVILQGSVLMYEVKPTDPAAA